MRTLYVKPLKIYYIEVISMLTQNEFQKNRYRHADFLQTIPLTKNIYKKLFLKRKSKLK